MVSSFVCLSCVFSSKSIFWVVYFTFHGSLCCLVPVLFGFHIFWTQNQHFGWFPLLVMVPSVVWLQCVFHLKSTFWVVPITFMVASVVWLPYFTQYQFFGWFPSLVMVPIVVWFIGAFCSKSTFWVFPSLYGFPVLFVSTVFSTQNQYFGWFTSLFMVLCAVWFQCCLVPIFFPLKINILDGSLYFYGSQCCLAPKCSLLILLGC